MDDKWLVIGCFAIFVVCISVILLSTHISIISIVLVIVLSLFAAIPTWSVIDADRSYHKKDNKKR